MRTHRLIILFALLSITGCRTAQTISVVKPAKYDEDLSVHRPSLGETIGLSTRRTEPTVIPEGHIKMELDSISNMISRENTKPRIEQGFTILLYNGSNRENATRALGRIRMRFPEIKAKMTYFQPDFKVKAGRFVDRIMAYETYERVRKNFPEALLIPEKIRINYD